MIRDTCETVVAGGHGQGNRLDQLDSPGYIFVDKDYSVYISDEKNHRVMKWIKGATEGIVVAGGQGKGNGLAQLSGPREVLADQLGIVVVGGNNQGKQSNQLYHPQDMSFDQQGNLYVVDCSNNRIQRFKTNSTS
ncbi:unnamed protein product, partial [Rotaria sp. Silwood2]